MGIPSGAKPDFTGYYQRHRSGGRRFRHLARGHRFALDRDARLAFLLPRTNRFRESVFILTPFGAILLASRSGIGTGEAVNALALRWVWRLHAVRGPTFMTSMLYAVGITAFVLLICIAVELASAQCHYTLRDRLPGLLIWAILPIFVWLCSPVFGTIRRSLGVHPLFDFSGWTSSALLLLFVVTKDFFNYWQHRFDHRFIWPVHAVHHTARELHAANGYAHPLQSFSEFAIISIPLTLIGFNSLLVPILLSVVVMLQATIIHCPTRVNLGPLWRIFVDNRFHRIHHSLEERHFGKNYGTVFTIWDQMFGTAYFPSNDEWPDVGLADYDPPSGLWDYITHPLRHFPAIWTPKQAN